MNKKIFTSLIIFLLILQVFLFLIPLPYVKAQTNNNTFVKISTDKTYICQGGNFNINLLTNISAAVIQIYFPNGTIYQVYSQSANSSQNISFSPNAAYGTYLISATALNNIAQTHIDVLDTTWITNNLSPMTNYTKIWKNIQYTFYYNGTVKALDLSTQQSLTIDLYTLRALATTVTPAYYSSTSFKLHISGGNTTIDATFAFVYGGCEFIVNGTLNQAGNFVFNYPTGLQQNSNAVSSGDLTFSYQDLSQTNQVFTANNTALTLSLSSTFSFDPIIFSSGFETNDFSAWTGTSGSAVTTTSSYAHTGSYSAHIGDTSSYMYKSVTPSNLTDIQVYFIAPTSLPAAGDVWNIIQYGDNAYADNFYNLRLYNDGTNTYWKLTYWLDGTGYVNVNYVCSITQSHWYCLDVVMNVSSTQGLYYVYVDKLPVIAISGISNIQLANSGIINIGSPVGSSAGLPNYYVDDISISNTGLITYPQYSNLNASTFYGGVNATLSSYWTQGQNVSLSNYIFQTNVTGTTVNSTGTFSSTPSWANKTISLTTNGSVQWQVFVNNTNGYWNATSLHTITITSVYNVTSAIMNGTRFNPASTINITGIVTYNNTSTPVTSGTTVYVAQTNNLTSILGSTSSFNSTGGFTITGTLSAYVGATNYTIYTSGLCNQNKTILPIVDEINVLIAMNNTSPTSGQNVTGSITATYQYDGAHIPYSTLTINVARNGTASYASGNFTDSQVSGVQENYTISSISESTYGLNVIYSKNTPTVIWGSLPIIQIPLIAQSSTRTGINQSVTISYQVQYGNGTSVSSGTLTINGGAVSVSSGWANFTSTSSTVGLASYTLTAVNCSGITAFSQAPTNPQIIFDNLIVSFSTSNSNPSDNANVTISWTVMRQYDNSFSALYIMNVTRDSLPFLNNTSAVYATDLDTETSHTYSASFVNDTNYGTTSFTVIPLTLTWHTPTTNPGTENLNYPTATPYVQSSSTPVTSNSNVSLSQTDVIGIVIVVFIIIFAAVIEEVNEKNKSLKHSLKSEGAKIWG